MPGVAPALKSWLALRRVDESAALRHERVDSAEGLEDEGQPAREEKFWKISSSRPLRSN